MEIENFDNIDRILKSIVPIKYTFSNISKKLDKSFKFSSLDNLVKSLDVKYVYKDQFEPTPEIVLHKNDYNINFQNSYEYLDELSDINNLPFVLQNKNCLKDGEFNPDFEYETGKNVVNKKYLIEEQSKRKMDRLKKRIERLKKFRESDSNIDSGKYHPNYDAIKRRSPCAYIREPNKHIKDSWLVNCPFRNTFEDFKRMENERKEKEMEEIKNKEAQNNNNLENNNNVENNNIVDNLNTINNINSINTINNIENENRNNIFNNNSSYNTNENSQRSALTRDINKDKIRKEEKYLSYRGKNMKIKNKVSKIKKLNLPIISSIPKRQNSLNYMKFNSPKKRINRSVSYEKMSRHKTPIVFKKMTGRTNLFQDNKYLISYSPNYNSMLPHIPSTIFKYIKNKQNYKKYMNGKIIRGYYYNPRDYYVMELQREEEEKKKLK